MKNKTTIAIALFLLTLTLSSCGKDQIDDANSSLAGDTPSTQNITPDSFTIVDFKFQDTDPAFYWTVPLNLQADYTIEICFSSDDCVAYLNFLCGNSYYCIVTDDLGREISNYKISTSNLSDTTKAYYFEDCTYGKLGETTVTAKIRASKDGQNTAWKNGVEQNIAPSNYCIF